MLKKCKLRMWEENPTIDIEDGTTIPYEKIGWIACQYGGYPEDVFYEKMTKEYIKFILENSIECAIEMYNEPLESDDFLDESLYEGEANVKLYKGKVIIHYV